MNEDKKVYVVFGGNSVIGFNKNGWKTENYSFLSVKDGYMAEWDGTEIALTLEQVIDLLEYDQNLNGNDVYEFNNRIPYGFVDELKKGTKKAMHRLHSIGNFTNAELIDVLKSEKNVDNSITTDAVKRPSHYMLEDGTEVKNHIRSILGDDGFKSWAIGNAIKYVSRYKDKGKPIQDLKKAQENIQMVIDVLYNQESDGKLNKLDL